MKDKKIPEEKFEEIIIDKNLEKEELLKTPFIEEIKPEQKESRKNKFEPTREEIISAWNPKTELGFDVKNKKIPY